MQLDYTFLNLESGVFSQLYEEQYLSFSNKTFDGSVPAQKEDNKETVFPTYVSLAAMNGPSGTKCTPILQWIVAFPQKDFGALIDGLIILEFVRVPRRY